ncbi:hypothetical protein [Halorubrum trueperi]|uniref:NrS-1 polymerase-like HBD domain-containing protein n=1 Tax=Halorubrum trueperi TaxID=2004704 RepID=A0ABD5ULR6_9EURY
MAATPVDGLGVVFTADDPLVGVDLDDCRDPETETPTAWAADVIGQLDSYTEVSPSETGYHILITGDLPEGRNRAGDIELYDRARFFTVTGDHVADTPTSIEARTEALATLHAERVAVDTSESATAAPSTAAETGSANAAGPGDLADSELIDRATQAANGDKFSRLWQGDTSGYPSQSEADMALCSLLAFWTGGDTTRVDRLFRQSGLMRDKWDEVHYADGSTYGATTVDRAVARTTETYTPAAAEDSPATTDDPRTLPASAADSAHTATTETAATEADTVDTTTRAEARLDRITELTSRLEAVLAENEQLREELAAERERREALEAEGESADTGWWPFS